MLARRQDVDFNTEIFQFVLLIDVNNLGSSQLSVGFVLSLEKITSAESLDGKTQKSRLN